MTKAGVIFLIQCCAASLIAPIAMTLMGFTIEVAFPGILRYLSNACPRLNDCLIQPTSSYLGNQKTWRFFLLFWGIGWVMVISIAYQELKPWVHEWFRKFK